MSNKNHHHDGCCHHEEQEPSCCHSASSCSSDLSQGGEYCNFPDQLLQVADEAWMELLKEKIKKQIEITSGKRLDELAKLVNESNHARWHVLFAEKRGTDEYKHKLRDYFHSAEGKKHK